MLKKTTLSALAAMLLVGCANYEGRPSVAYLSPDAEYKLKSAAHWRIVADDLSSQVAAVAKGANSSVFVPVNSSTAFGRVFPSMLRTSLLKQGVAVLDKPDQNALTVGVAVDSVEHVTLPQYKAGSISALAAGVLVARHGFDSANSAAASVAGLLVGADAIVSIEQRRKRPSTEIVLTTSIQKANSYVMHETSTYYVDSVDLGLFERTGKQYALVGGAK